MTRDPYRLPLLVEPELPGWQRRANCTGEDPDLFYPDAKGGRRAEHVWADIQEAQAICDGCKVKAHCAEVGRDEPDGIWGGVFRTSTPDTRRRLAALMAEQEGGAA